ncbi:MAG TPA: tRNA lysidine(34) synthetase TilS [Beijerinckiaceae bacterium]|nr:tRNA lysidine(34) synthetase TilS [Beijerinckiaceae bacterium]
MAPASAQPAGVLDLETALAPFANASGWLVAVSGGPDSMALLRLVAAWAEHRAYPVVHAATVDHGLRPDSRAEAETVHRWAADIGVAHSILTWRGEKPATRIQERARAARYALLADHAKAIGASVLLTAHHADDQAETILFRLLRGSHVGGLAGMAAVVRRGALSHIRPLLGTGKSDLVAFCQRIGQPYVSDPSNDNPRYARTRMRRLMASLESEGLNRDALLRFAHRSARAEAALAETAARARDALKAARTATSFAAPAREFATLAEETCLRVLLGEISRIGGDRRPPRLERAEALLVRLLPALRARTPFAATLGGTRIRVVRGDLRIDSEGPRRANMVRWPQLNVDCPEKMHASLAGKPGLPLARNPGEPKLSATQKRPDGADMPTTPALGPL